ncbi:MAG: hypothetical protein PHQ74_14035 [Crocinitomicaceae bacterium]|nr:hypothetical protein [Crocinitomicaceae bacterium]
MKVITALLLICMTLNFNVNAQVKKKKKAKTSYAKGTMFGYWGYNRSAYTKSNLRFVGEGYDFTLKQSKASDNPSTKFKEYMDLGNLTVPQFNARVGYYFKDKWAISFGYDHMKYLFNDRNQVLLDGFIRPGLDTVWTEGNYNDKQVTTNRENFHYENSNGLNYLHFEIMRSQNLYRTKNKKFGVTGNVGLGLGSLLSFNDFDFAQQKDMVTISMSGYAASAHLGLRLEFFNHFFLQGEMSGGFMHQVKVKTRSNDLKAYASQKYGYAMGQVVAGFFLYLKPTNGCDDCPKW